ncbi:MAG TPA: (2Fe-2S) ferredoxin domain-containing protein [Verrucomicrobiae bacterium]|nr:(2Fe-2S) ferredoxin domain-containing protein [Verrucomicrobiae bacterium]
MSSEFEMRPMNKSNHTLSTKRLVIGNVAVCFGCCCGQTDRGKPGVPVEWLKSEWRLRGLLKNMQLSISGCLGPCDVPNVVRIDTPEERIWLGNIERTEQYQELVDWATRSKAAGRCLPLPRAFDEHTLDPFK